MYYATKEFRFEMAHILTNYNGLCGNLHGHSYKCLITFTSNKLNSDNMVMDFSTIKAVCNDAVFNRLDHSFAVNTNSSDPCEIDLWHTLKHYNKRISEFSGRTTAEYMSKWIYLAINKVLENSNVKCCKVELWETTTGHATYKGE